MNYLNAVGHPGEDAHRWSVRRSTPPGARRSCAGLFITGGGELGQRRQPGAGVRPTQGSYAYGGYPDIDDLFQQQARERVPARREALLFRIQQLTIDRVMFAPIMDFRALMGVGPRVAEHTITSIHNSPFPSYEDMRLKD